MFAKVIFKSEGFSLIEIILALFVLAIGILGYISLFGSSIRGTTFSRQYTQAVIIAQRQLDRLINSSYESVDLSPGIHGPTTYLENGFSTNCTYIISDSNTSTTSNTTIIYKKIQLDVAWNEDNEPYQLTFFARKKRE